MKLVRSEFPFPEAKSRAARPVRRVRFGFVFLLVVVVAIIAAQAHGQQPPATMQLNLQQAVQIALKQNPSVQIAVLNLAESHKESNIALSQLLPQADFNVSDRAMRENIEANIGLSIPGFPEAVGPFQVFQFGSNFSAPIFDLSLWRQWQGSKKNISSADAQRLSVREQIVLLVVSQYLTSLRSSAEISAAQAEVDLAQALYDQASDMEKHGATTGVDVLRANVELQNEKQLLIIAQTNQQIALYGLAKLLNYRSDAENHAIRSDDFFRNAGYPHGPKRGGCVPIAAGNEATARAAAIARVPKSRGQRLPFAGAAI